MDSNTEQKLKAIKTTPRQSRMLQDWNIPASTSDTDNATGIAWSGHAIVSMLPDKVTDGMGREAPFDGNRIWYRGASPIFNTPDPMQNLVDMVVWMVKSGRGSQLLIDPQPEKPWDEFLQEKERSINAEHMRNMMQSQPRNEERASGWARN